MFPLWPHGQQRNQLPGDLRRRLGLLKRRPCRGCQSVLALLLVLTGPWAALEAQELPGEDFGRWEGGLRRCRIVSSSGQAPPQPPSSCRLLRLDQQMEGLLTVRFLQPGGSGAFLDRQLVFAGVLAEGSKGMQCLASRCEPRWPLQLRVSAVGQAGFGETTAALGLTRAQLASGHCHLDGRAFRCEAVGPEGQRWQAEASP
ncbi:hypothetical protein KQ305_04930 [Synechococcus sp. CS-1332]|nr:hypothetical protein [Synechococcus sp. CS-1332]